MNVNREDYIIIGTNLIEYNNRLNELEENTDIEAWEEREKKEKEANDVGLEFVFDVFNEEYLIVGQLIAKSNEYEEIDLIEVDTDNINNICREVADKIKRIFDMDVKPSLLVFTHSC